jgi:hypothetical protein
MNAVIPVVFRSHANSEIITFNGVKYGKLENGKYAKYEDILDDYLITNKSYQDIIDDAVALGKERNVDPEILDAVSGVNGVDKSYLTKAYDIIMSYGSPKKFFKNALNIDEKYIDEAIENTNKILDFEDIVLGK